MLKRPRHIILILVVVLALGLLTLPGRMAARLKLGLAGLYLPLFGLSLSSQAVAAKAGNALLPRSELTRQIDQLHLEIQQLRLNRNQDDELLRENTRLRQLLAWRAQSPWKCKLARVIGRDPSNWWKAVRIDLGRRDGANVNCPVMTTDGLLGRISLADYASSEVILLGDPNLRVGAVVRETRETGIILAGGSSSVLNDFVDLAYLAGGSSVKPGQRVETSGEGGVFPRGLPVGVVVDTRTVDFGLATEARVRLAARTDDLEEVWVLLP
jgi:rod shape-determining protein MreC